MGMRKRPGAVRAPGSGRPQDATPPIRRPFMQRALQREAVRPAPTFNTRKAAQVVAYFAVKQGGNIDVLKVAKLLYLADRHFMDKYDVPILHDRMVSMDHGPVTSTTLNLINGMFGDLPEWREFVAGRAGYRVGAARKVTPEALDEL